MQLDRLDEAAGELDEAVRRDSKQPQPHLLLSQIYFRLGKEDRAREEKNLSMRLRRENPATLEVAQGRAFR